MILLILIIIPLILCVAEVTTHRGVEKKPASDELKELLKHKAEQNRKDSE